MICPNIREDLAQLTRVLVIATLLGSLILFAAAASSSKYRNRWNGSTLTYVPLIARFKSDQKFSEPVRVDLPASLGFGVVNDLMNIVV